MILKRTKWEMKPENIMAAVIIYLILTWGFSYLIDVHDFLGLHSVMYSDEADVNLLWFYIFVDGGPTEWFQWTLLLGTALLSSYSGGRLVSLGHRKAASFWIIMSAASVFLFVEDAFNTRHILASFTMSVFDAEDFTNPIKTITYLIYFTVLASIPLYAFIRYWRSIWSSTKTRLYLIIGFCAYGTAGIASGTRDIYHWYGVVGEFINNQIAGGAMSQYFTQTEPTRPLGFYLMDSLVEESIELIAAGALLTAAAAYIQYLNHISEKNEKLEVKNNG